MRTARIGVVVFPGSNCEYDAACGIEAVGAKSKYLWHTSTDLSGVDAVILPGGFAHGDYLRVGALARFAPIMTAVAEFANQGRPVLGICNGFQVLTEAGMLPGALQKNVNLAFLCQSTPVVVATQNSALTRNVALGRELSIPINHFTGSYVCDPATLAELEDGDRVVLRYADNPNGSMGAIAAIRNARGNVVGLMPHPERAVSALTGGVDGRPLLESFVEAAIAS